VIASNLFEEYKIKIQSNSHKEQVINEFATFCVGKNAHEQIPPLWIDVERYKITPMRDLIDLLLNACVLTRNTKVANAIIDTISKQQLHANIQTLDSVASFNAKNGDVEKAINALKVVMRLRRTKRIEGKAFSHLLQRYKITHDLPNALDTFKNIAEHCLSFGNYDVWNIVQLCNENHKIGDVDIVWKHIVSSDAVLNVESFAVLLRHFKDTKRFDKTLDVIHEILRRKLEPNAQLLTLILSLCADAKSKETGEQVIQHMTKTNIKRDAPLVGSIIKFYAECGDTDKALQEFEQMIYRNQVPSEGALTILLSESANTKNQVVGQKIITFITNTRYPMKNSIYGALIKFYLAFDQFQETFHSLNDMIRNGLTLHSQIVTSLLSWCADKTDFEKGSQVMHFVEIQKYRLSGENYGALIKLFTACDKIDLAYQTLQKIPGETTPYTVFLLSEGTIRNYEQAHQVVDGLKHRTMDAENYSAKIRLYGKWGLMQEAMQTFEDMKNVVPTKQVFRSLIYACTETRSIEEGFQVYKSIPAKYLEDSVVIADLILMFGKLTFVDKAKEIFGSVEKKTTEIYTAMIIAYGDNGFGKEALALYDTMKKTGAAIDQVVILSVLVSCSHAHLVNDALEIYNKLNVEPTLKIENAIVDTLARAGEIERAISFANKMKETNDVTWTSILSACRNQRQTEFGIYAAERAIQSNPMESSSYIALSQIYLDARMVDKANETICRMQQLGLKKLPGITTVVVNGQRTKLHARSTPVGYTYAEMKNMRAKYFEKLEEYGYVMNTAVVTDNVSEAEKRDILREHSEKTGLILMLNDPNRGEDPIRIFKNLRVCEDCHNAFTVASKAYGREIFLQDKRRTHHFVNGVCNCGGKW
jgi:pentatricopeptide repeat protein